MGVLPPRVREAALGDHGPEVRVRQHVDPRGGRCLSRNGRDDVFAAVGREPSEPVEQDQVARGWRLRMVLATVVDLQHREFHRCIGGHVHPQLGVDAVLVVLEDAVAESVTGDVGPGAAAGQRCRRPEVPGLLVAQEQGLPARVGHGVVVPRRETELVSVLAPRVRDATLGDHGAEVRVREHIGPGRRRRLARDGRDDVLPAIARESAEPVEQDQVARGWCRRWRLALVDPGRHEAWHPHLPGTATGDLLHEAAAAVADDGAGDGLQQDAVVVRDLFRAPHEDPARAIDDVRFDAGGDQPHDLILQDLAVSAAILVPDHEVDGQSLQPPVGVRLHQAAHEIDVGRVLDLQQDDRMVARDRVAPQPGLAAPIAEQNAGFRAQRRIGVDDGAGEAPVELRVGLRGIDLAQRHPAVRPGEVEDAVREMPILVLLDQSQRGIARVGHAGRDVDRRRLLRIERHPVPYRDDRVQDRPFAARQPSRLRSSPAARRRCVRGR